MARTRTKDLAQDEVSTKRKADTLVETVKLAKSTAVDELDDDEALETPKSKKRTSKRVKVEENKVDEQLPIAKKRTSKKAKETATELADEDKNGTLESAEPKKRTAKKAKVKGAEIAPLEERSVGSKLRVGAHVSIAGGVHNAISNLLHIGANAFALFLKNQRKWDNPAMDPEHATLFMDGCKKHSIQPGDCCLPHGSYLVNLAHPDAERKKQAYKSFHDDLTRCHQLGIRLYNFHPGNCNATTRENGIKLIAENVNKAHRDPSTGQVVTVLETMASLGNTIGGTFLDLAEIIALVENKERIGVCLDTCHIFAAGYDLRTPDAYAATMKEFDDVIGLSYLKAFHINDSKAPFRSHRDLHARIGTGYLGLRSFHNIVNDERLHGLPMILETPIEVVGEDGKKKEDKTIWAREIKMLEKLVGMDVDCAEFQTLEKTLFDEGTSERERVGDQVERKKKKDATPKKSKRKKVEVNSDTESDE
ncbi:xylose isomerase-like protein [Massariosphaeria phaeospora]|uniref:Apurinic-apyrimidinic endonuclease 1 n=1 Tax=Massariosphaeria phaeospora TaxID=100035 RepID=A0A7C8ID35_9PLEO|nr:xylose isomerase-like protein [Massariosphaeria phaeospora]